jgi:hypothetical protein
MPYYLMEQAVTSERKADSLSAYIFLNQVNRQPLLVNIRKDFIIVDSICYRAENLLSEIAGDLLYLPT